MINVCTNYYGAIILLESFNTQEDAKSFMQHDYVLHYKDELEDAEEDEVISSDMMFVEDEIPFYEQPYIGMIDSDELPF